MNHKAGFVNIIGNPNVGKSTLMNALVGERLSIITPKAQTTRHRILGILNDEDYQVVFSDLPGILSPGYRLQEKMLGYIETALTDADIFLYMVEAGEKAYKENVVTKINNSGIPVFVVINKIDLSEQTLIQEQIKRWQQVFPGAEVIPVSALHRFNLDKLLSLILNKLPENPPYYDKEDITDKSLRFIVSEIIREKVLLYYKQEIPYSVEVAIDSFKEGPDLIKISAWIFVMRETQKMIVIGQGGKALKKVGTEARKDMEAFLGKKVFLEMNVKVSKDWRDSDRLLKRFGYEN
ncbi:MAG: GTPase Era [Bacteroidales bacterium]|nr:GTPase Era [Bacteroidales bacterium]